MATGKSFLIRRDSTCDTRNVIYCAICTKHKIQGVGSTTCWKPRSRNYKYHINNNINSCGIAKHFIDVSLHAENPLCRLKFIILDCLNNVNGLSTEEIDALLLEKEKFWIATLVTQHKGMNVSHDWNREKRCDKNK